MSGRPAPPNCRIQASLAKSSASIFEPTIKTLHLMQTTVAQPTKGRLWTGRIISGICILFLLFDAITKIFKEHHTIEASAKLGWPVDTLQPLGVVLLLCTILYAIPRTAT